MGITLYVGNLGDGVTGADLERMFAAHGTVLSAALMSDGATGRGNGFAFVQMKSEDGARAAIAALDGQKHQDRVLNVMMAGAREESGPRRGDDAGAPWRDRDARRNGGPQRGGFGDRGGSGSGGHGGSAW